MLPLCALDPRLALPSRSLSRATRSGSPSRLSAPSLARPGPRCCEWKGCRYRQSGRRSGRIGFLKRVDDQIVMQSAIHSDPTRREDYCSRAYLGYVLAFICGLQGGAAPMGPNPLDAPPAIAAVASVGAVGPPAVSAQPLGPSPPPPQPPPVYSTTQQPADALALGHWVGQPSVDVMTRPTATGFREAGLLLNGLAGGCEEDIYLTPSARRVLHAQQMLLGTRAAAGRPVAHYTFAGRTAACIIVVPAAARGPTDRSASEPESRAPRSDSGHPGRRASALAL